MSVFIGYPSFMTYQMMKGKKDNNDGFPSIPGMIARYSALGLTNEQMAANPVWADKTGNDHDLQMKNFAWGGMSGVGGYSDNFSSDSWKKPSDRSDITWTSSSFNITRVMNTGVQIYYFSTWEESESVIPEKRIIVKGLEDGQVLRYMNVGNRIIEISQDGIYTIPSFTFKGANSYHGYSLAKKQESCNVTVEQLPLYPGALVFDGVDDCGVCDNFPILTKEKGYTVVALRSYLAESIGYLVYNGTNAKQSAFAFERPDSLDTWSWGKNSSIRNSLPKLMSYQTSNSYNNNPISTGEVVESNNIINVAYGGGYCNVAIWELVFLDHDATEEELTKIKDYFVKTYPWLFPDQAWTVTGKTNEDEDRATIANITGNGNNLVLSNFGFSKNSGYGLYAENYNGGRWVKSTDRADITWTSYSVNIISVKVASTQLYYQSYPEQPSFTVPSYKIKVYGLKDGQTLSYKQATSEGQQIYKISEDGIYTLPSFLFKANGDWYGFTLDKIQETCDITIEQIPEYEGYLVTDGVDDKVASVNAVTLNKDFTVVGEWRFKETEIRSNCGIVVERVLFVYNIPTGIRIYIHEVGGNFTELQNIKSLKAICSNGIVYDENWNPISVKVGSLEEYRNKLLLGYPSNFFTQIAFKNMSIYSNQVLSKEDCIKAYNYLQSLKAK